MDRIDDIIACVNEMAPEDLAEPWDNCGLIIASEREYAERIIVCLDVTRAVVDEAIGMGAHLIIAHHPPIFNPIKRIGRNSEQSALLRSLIKNDIAVYAAHTNVDKTYGGLNDLLAGIIGVETPAPDEASEPLSYFRVGELPRGMTAREFDEHARLRLKVKNLAVSAVTAPSAIIKRVAVMCGSYSFSAERFRALKADALLCGEIKYHDMLDLAAMGVHVVQAGHHGTERFFINLVKRWIADKYPGAQARGVGFSSPPIEIYNGGNAGGDV